jgi:hypothetical protein
MSRLSTLAAALLLPGLAAAQDLTSRAPTPSALGNLRLDVPVLYADPGPRRAPSLIPLLGMPAGFLHSPAGLEDEAGGATEPEAGDDEPFRVVVGQNNPFFDFHSPLEPTGAGYYRLHTQYQMFQEQDWGACVGLRALTPAGLESNGAGKGLTVFSPTLAWYQRIEEDTILHCSIGGNIRARPGWEDSMTRSLHWGVAAQHRLFDLSADADSSLHFFLELLGNQPFYDDAHARVFGNWGVLPGLHLRCRDSWWLSTGVMLPFNMERGLWQFTWSCQF